MSSITKIATNKPVVRETLTSYRHQNPIIVELHPGFLVLRLKGRKLRWSTTYDNLLERLMWDEANRLIKEKKATG